MVVLHGISISACWFNDLPIGCQLMLFLLVMASAVIQHRACQTTGVHLRYTAQEGWAISFDGQRYSVISVKPSTVVGSWLTVLYFETDRGATALAIFNDAMSANDYRRLIVNLKILGCSEG